MKVNLIEQLFRNFFLYETHLDNASRQMHSSSPYRKAWTMQTSMRKKRETDGDEREGQEGCAAKNGAERWWFLTTVGQKEGNAKGDRGGSGLRDIEYEYSTRAATAGEVAVDVLATLSATSYVSFPFHFQSLGGVQEPETPDLSRDRREQRYIRTPPIPYSPLQCARCWREINWVSAINSTLNRENFAHLINWR